MGSVRGTGRVKLISGLISKSDKLLEEIVPVLEKVLKNKVDFESPILDFNHTGYYEDEMGKGLKRKFLSFACPVRLEGLYKVKLATNKVEKSLSRHAGRKINIDPGYIDLAKLVLFSTKDYTHRIYAGKGIFAEATLYYKDKNFRHWPWTYPDFRTDAYKKIFASIREIFKKGIRS